MKRDDFIRIGGVLINKAHIVSVKVFSSVAKGRYVESDYGNAAVIGSKVNLYVLLSTSVGDFECLRTTNKLDDVSVKSIKVSRSASPFDRAAVDARDEFLQKTKEMALAEADFLEKQFFDMLENGDDIQANKLLVKGK